MGGGEFAACEWGEFLMPIDYLVTDTELSDIADAIRAKGGTSAALVYPTGFVSAINDISTGGVVTRQVTFEYNDADAMYYTDATMTPQSITSGDKDINAELPVGSLVVYARAGMAPPMPFPLSTSGVQQIASYTVGSRGNVKIYEVLPE